MKNIILFGGSEYEKYSKPEPERIRQNYLIDFEKILELNVHIGENEEVKYENGREIGFTVFIDERDIGDLPIDWQKVEFWTKEEETAYREQKARWKSLEKKAIDFWKK